MRRAPLRLLALLVVVAAASAACSDGGGGDDHDRAADRAESDATDDTVHDDPPPGPEDPDLDPFALTVDGLGELRFGMSEDEASATGLIEEWAPGCELGGPGATAALLAEPLSGSVFAQDGVIEGFLVVGGPVTTEPGGVAVGSSRADAEAAFAGAGLAMEVDETAVDTFGVHFWSVRDGDKALFGGSIDPDTGLVAAVAAPRVFTCE